MKKFALILACALITVSPGFAEKGGEKCIHKETHESVSYLLIDRSDKIADIDGFNKSVATIKGMIQPGERLIVGISTDKVSDSKILMDFVNPQSSIWSSPLKIRAQEKQFSQCFEEAIAKVLALEEEYDKSALLETFTYVGKILGAEGSTQKRLYIYSDMVQNSSVLSFYSKNDAELNAPAIMKRAESEGLLANLSAVDVYVSGAGARVSDKRARSLEALWTAYFAKSGAKLKFFGPVLLDL